MTQNQLVLEHLQKYGSLTSGEAWSQYGISRLASRICDLKKMGYEFEKNTIRVQTKRGDYVWVTDYHLL